MDKDEKEERSTWETNRDKVLSPKLGLFYCQCDLTHVGNHRKCEVCGRRNGRYRFKK